MSFFFDILPALGLGAAGSAVSAALPLAGASVTAGGLATTATGFGLAAAGGAGAWSTGSILSAILEGAATVGGLVSSISAGQADNEAAIQQAEDTEAEKPLEILQGIDRRRGLKAAAAQAIGEMDTAYSASGVDLSFGSAAQARTEAFRELDLGLESDVGTTRARVARLTERAANYRRIGKRALRAGYVSGFSEAAGRVARIAQRY